LESEIKEIRESALITLLATTQLRAERTVRGNFAAESPSNGRRTIFDCQGGNLDAAVVARSEDSPASTDETVNRAFDSFGKTRDFYKQVFDRDSIDGRGMRLEGYVHFRKNYNNAGWDGQRMIFGDGDGSRFTDFTKSIDVIAHELAHGVTQFTAKLDYHKQPGALNESMSDVFGSLVKQWSLKQKAADADWLMGAEIFTPSIKGDALRSLKEPGKAYDNPLFGKDPQPDHMSKFVHMPDDENNDNGGVHYNSGIPNKAFYLAAMEVGGFAWEAPGLIWYESLKDSTELTDFEEFADTTFTQAERLFGANSVQQRAVLAAWKAVGVKINRLAPGAAFGRGVGRLSREEDPLASISRQLDALSAQVRSLSKEIEGLKGKR